MAGDLVYNRNEILTLIKQGWDSLPTVFPGFPPQAELVYTMNDGDGIPKDVSHMAWARVTVQHGVAKPTSVIGRRWLNLGILTVQCFVWRATTRDDDRVQRVASYLVGKLRDHRGSVLFLDATPREMPINNGFAQCDAISRFQWEEFRTRS